MPVTVNWYNEEKTIIYYEFDGIWTLDELWNIFNTKILEFVSDVPYLPDTIMSFNASTFTPTGLLSFWRHSYDWMQDNQLETALVMFVNPPHILRGIGDTLRNLRVPIMQYMFFVESIEEAQTFIETFRAKTPPKQSMQ